MRQEKYELLQIKENYGRQNTEYALEIDQLKQKCNKFELNIITPKEGDKVFSYSLVRGTISGELPDGQFIWVVSNIESVPGLWWPQEGPIKPLSGLWDADVWLGSAVDTGKKFSIAVILVNETDNQVFMKYREEGNETGNFPAIKLPDSATIMDSIIVTRI